MAKQTLPTNFVDDILSPSMGGKRRFNLIQNDDGTYSFEDVTDYTQTGSDFGAGQINATNQAVNESCDKADVIDDLEDVVANQANGKIAGAKAVATLNVDLSKLNANMINGKFSVSEEIDTRMTWINGKKIYRKTLTTSEAIDSSGLSVSHGISNPDEIWIDYSMSYMGTTSGIFIPLNTNRYNGKNIGITIITTKSDVQFNSDSSFGTGWTKVITLLYTKK